ncbi:uncharacterized protein IUM83_17304 [Phytophthora cinnamomi]|uniref:uncharacterized protein n=1 Tax=Phytophthora cinnamomi TaxID=4785 RepID=UPI0035597105|nr:hypothetical protein IUM83_17304 [Phytophthora cinnamomi]
MSFLLGDDYASSSSEGSESDAQEQVTSPAVRHKQGQDEKQQASSSTQLLPSADSVLSSVSASTASYLAPKSSAKPASSVKTFDLLEERETQRREQEKEDREQKQQQQQEAETRRNERKRPPPPASRAQPAKRDKKDAKERVKNQRVKGQAGIGSDFRGWKSETEMALRQQFD